MTIVVPIAIPAAGQPLPDPADRATFSARKLEQLRWANNEYATYSYNLGVAAYSNALDAQANAVAVAANALAVAANTALAASYAGATVWVTGTTYAIGDRRYSPANGLVYRRLTAGAGTTDPSADATNWAPVAVNAPAQTVTAAVTQAISGQCLALTNTTAQGAATNIALQSKTFSAGVYTYNLLTTSAAAAAGVDGAMTMFKLVETSATGSRFWLQSLTGYSVTTQYAAAVYAKAGGRSLYSMTLDDGGTNGVSVTFNLSTGAISSGPSSFGNGSAAAASITHMGDGIYDCRLTGVPSATPGTSLRFLSNINGGGSYTGDGVSGVYVDDLQVELGALTTSRITTTVSFVTRSAGLVAPQRIVLPASPAANSWVSVVPANGITTNVIDPNGQTFMGTTGPLVIDNANAVALKLQFINSSWRLV